MTNETTSNFPDRLSTDPASPHYNEEILSRDVGIKFNGGEKTNVEEYCISEGWILRHRGQRQGPLQPSADDQAQGHGRALFQDTRQPDLRGCKVTGREKRKISTN